MLATGFEGRKLATGFAKEKMQKRVDLLATGFEGRKLATGFVNICKFV